MVGNYGSDNIMVMFNDGDGTFGNKIDTYTSTNQVSGMTTADFNLDEKPDFATSNYAATYYMAVHLHKPKGSIVIAKDVGAQMIRGVRWVEDTDLDTYPDAVDSPIVAAHTRPSASHVRKNYVGGNFNHIVATGGTITDANGMRTHTFSAAGTYTFSVTTATSDNITIEVWGPGGGGGAGGSASSGGGGGSGGAYAKKTMTLSTGDYTVYVSAGQAGSIVQSMQNTQAGTSYFHNLTTVKAVGGRLGWWQGATPGVVGGLAADSIGDVKYSGGSGGDSGNNSGGGGGGSAGTASDGNTGGATTGAAAVIGGGPGGNSNASPSTGPGGGGGGGLGGLGYTDQGATGKDGQVKISYPLKIDCAPTNASYWGFNQSSYLDSDQDGYGTGDLIGGCIGAGDVLQPGYAINNTDCDDNVPTRWTTATVYADHDGDGYGVTTVASRSASAAFIDSTDPLVIEKPAGVEEGDLLVASIVTSNFTDTSITPPAGWDLQETRTPQNETYDSTTNVYTKRATSSEPSTYSFSSAAANKSGIIASFYSVDPNSDVHAHSGNSSPTDATTRTTPVITTTIANSRLVAVYGSSANVSGVSGRWTSPAALSEVQNTKSAGTSNAMATVVQAAAGASAQYAATNSVTGLNGSTVILALTATNPNGCKGTVDAGEGNSVVDTDCNDLDNSKYQNIYLDSDNDTYGTGSLTCLGSTNTSVNNTDCNDSNGTIWETRTVYWDGDADNYGVDTVKLRSSSGTVDSTTGSTPITISKPTGTVEGDLLVAAIASSVLNATITPDQAWTLQETQSNDDTYDLTLKVYTRVASSSEPATYTFDITGGGYKSGAIGSFYDVDTSSPVDVAESNKTTSNVTTYTTPNFTTSLANEMVVAIFAGADNASDSWSVPLNMTELEDRPTGFTSLAMDYELKTAAGATTGKIATTSALYNAASALITIKPKGPPVTGCYGASGTYPASYVASNADCNDMSINVYQSLSVAVDADQDGYSAGASSTYCVGASTSISGRTYYKDSSGNYTYIASASILGYDCNDADVNVHPGAGCVITRRAVATTNDGGGGATSMTINKPTGTLENDTMITAISFTGSTTITPPSGWTLIRRVDNAQTTPHSVAVYYKVAGASEGANYAWSFNGVSTFFAAWSASYYNANVFAPIDTHNGQTNGTVASATTSYVAPSITTGNGYEMVISVHGSYGGYSGLTFTPPSGMTEFADHNNTGSRSIEGAQVAQDAAGATGNKTATCSSTSYGASILFALK